MSVGIFLCDQNSESINTGLAPVSAEFAAVSMIMRTPPKQLPSSCSPARSLPFLTNFLLSCGGTFKHINYFLLLHRKELFFSILLGIQYNFSASIQGTVSVPKFTWATCFFALQVLFVTTSVVRTFQKQIQIFNKANIWACPNLTI